MIQSIARVLSNDRVGPNISVLTLDAPQIAPAVQAGQFINIKVHQWDYPLLRRPFSVYRVNGARVEIIFSASGLGTSILSRKHEGDELDLLGPLGCPYTVDDDFETAILVAGGLGVAPFPLLTSELQKRGRTARTFLGARTGNLIIQQYLANVQVATDDGSAGFHGTVVDALRNCLTTGGFPHPKIFGCGPNPMLRSLSDLAEELRIPCEVSLESAMACGIGICQGCPIERVDGKNKYALVCKEGTVFDSRTIKIL